MAKKDKFLIDDESLAYKKRLKEFMAAINPKPDEETVNKLKQQYRERRGEN